MAYNKNRAIANIACMCKSNKSATTRLFAKLAVVWRSYVRFNHFVKPDFREMMLSHIKNAAIRLFAGSVEVLVRLTQCFLVVQFDEQQSLECRQMC